MVLIFVWYLFSRDTWVVLKCEIDAKPSTNVLAVKENAQQQERTEVVQSIFIDYYGNFSKFQSGLSSLMLKVHHVLQYFNFLTSLFYFTNGGKKGEGENVEIYNYIFSWNGHISGLYSQTWLADPNSLGSGRGGGRGGVIRMQILQELWFHV